jgi:hypothetical protein
MTPPVVRDLLHALLSSGNATGLRVVRRYHRAGCDGVYCDKCGPQDDSQNAPVSGTSPFQDQPSAPPENKP